jgi:amidase/aspartyl-tRNA(Asn)/glutamyl-tRNA(Gln) amidotransferase subunit A
VPGTVLTDGLEAPVAAAFESALARLSAAGARIEAIGLPEVGEIGALNARGTLAAAESWAWHRERLGTREAMYDPRVARRIRAGESMSAADYIELLQRRADWIARVERAIAPFDALLSPTLPIVAPPIAPLLASDDAFFATNAQLLRNPSVVNFLDGCAISLPCHAPGTMPVGLMVWAGPLADDTVLDAALAIEAALRG